MQEINIEATSNNTMREVFEIHEASEASQSQSSIDESGLVIKKRYNWWRRFINVLKRKS